MPPICPEWYAALSGVNRDQDHHPTVSRIAAGYMYPEAGFVAAVPPVRRASIVAAWLTIRPDRCAQLLHPSSDRLPLATATTWRAFFSLYALHPQSAARIEYRPEGGIRSRAQQCRLAAYTAARGMFGGRIMDVIKEPSSEVYWHHRSLSIVDGAILDLPDTTLREIVWELQELEWRYEVLALDRVLAEAIWRQEDADLTRTEKVTRVFTPFPMLVTWAQPFPTVNPAVSAATRLARIPALAALRELMLDWPACPPVLAQVSFDMPHLQDPTTPLLAGLEHTVMLFYCQSFYDHFGRPPVLPHRLPLQ